MTGVLTVKKLSKNYSAFKLNDISFSLEQGKITGFIGRNGAGKTTTLKSIFNFVHPDRGEVKFFDMDFAENEMEIKQQVGFVSGGVNYYSNKKLKTITRISKSFYSDWDDVTYLKYMKMFKLNESKTPAQLSEGMKVKYALTLALSHNAKLLILDEPTSGLDPVSRDEILDIFMDLCEEGVTILFSTHIITDLEKCADNIIYIRNGKLLAETDMKSFADVYRIYEVPKDKMTKELKENVISIKRNKNGYTVLADAGSRIKIDGTEIKADLENIMLHLEREEKQ